MTAPDPDLTVGQVAEQWSCSERFVLNELKRKRLRGSKLPIGWRVKQSDVDTYIAAHANVSRVRSTA